MNTIKVKVEQDHIERGERWKFDNCPLALALDDYYPGKWRIGIVLAVREYRARLDGTDAYMTSENWRLASDAVEPCELELQRRLTHG